jgi:choice-of-anchor B domain-containing protein
MIQLSKITVLVFTAISFGFAQEQSVTLISNVNDYPNNGYTDCWGYTAPNGDEYALLGVNLGISIVDVSDTNNITEVDFIPWIAFGWYDMKTYNNYMYVSTEGSREILIVDLSGLPESASIVGTYSGLSSEPHNIFIDTTMALLYIIEDLHIDPSVRIVSLADPTNPVELSTINPSIGGKDVHDLFAQDSVLYIAEGIDPSIGFYDVSDPSNPSLLTRLTIPAAGYVHQIWVSEDSRYMVTTEETAGRTIKLWDIQDIDNIIMLSEYLGESELTHNAYIHNGYIFDAHYESGLKILDISDPTDMAEVGYYDTYPASDDPDFYGAWGVYPFFTSGLILISDMQTGLYVFNFTREEGPQITAQDVNFGNVVNTKNDTLPLIIKNYGTETLTINSISDPGEPFSLIGVPELPLDLPSNKSLIVQVVFTTTDTGATSTSIIISSNDENNSEFEVQINGYSLVLTFAKDNVFYGITSNPSSLIEIDPATGIGSLIGSTGLSDVLVAGLAINSSGEIYCTTFSPAALYRVDAETGRPIFVTFLDYEVITGIAFDGNDVLYTSGDTDDLYTIDLTTGELTLIGTPDIGSNNWMLSMAFDPISGDLWISTWPDPEFIRKIDMTTLTSEIIGPPGPGIITTDLQFDQKGNLFGVEGVSEEGPNDPVVSNFISVSKSNGKATVIQSTGIESVFGMAAILDTFWNVKPQNVTLNNTMQTPGVDTLKIQSKIYNPNGYQLNVQTIVESDDMSISDTLMSFDDGAHDDSLSGDNIFGSSWPVKAGERFYIIRINAYPVVAGYLNNIYNAARFTTIGPIVIDEFEIGLTDTIANPGDRLPFRINLKNNSLSDSVFNLSTKTISMDSCASIYGVSDPQYDYIAPGEVAKPSRGFTILFSDECEEQTGLKFALEIYSNGYLFWSDTFAVFVDSIVSSIEMPESNLPNEYALKQNFPNPFNPTTTIMSVMLN